MLKQEEQNYLGGTSSVPGVEVGNMSPPRKCYRHDGEVQFALEKK